MLCCQDSRQWPRSLLTECVSYGGTKTHLRHPKRWLRWRLTLVQDTAIHGLRRGHQQWRHKLVMASKNLTLRMHRSSQLGGARGIQRQCFLASTHWNQDPQLWQCKSSMWNRTDFHNSRWVGIGYSSWEIAQELCLSPNYWDFSPVMSCKKWRLTLNMCKITSPNVFPWRKKITHIHN